MKIEAFNELVEKARSGDKDALEALPLAAALMLDEAGGEVRIIPPRGADGELLRRTAGTKVMVGGVAMKGVTGVRISGVVDGIWHARISVICVPPEDVVAQARIAGIEEIIKAGE